MRVMLLHKLAEDIPEDYVPETDRGRREDGERRRRCAPHVRSVMLWLGELRSLDQVVQSGADCPMVITNCLPEITAASMADILKRCNEDPHPPPSTGASRCC